MRSAEIPNKMCQRTHFFGLMLDDPTSSKWKRDPNSIGKTLMFQMSPQPVKPRTVTSVEDGTQWWIQRSHIGSRPQGRFVKRLDWFRVGCFDCDWVVAENCASEKCGKNPIDLHLSRKKSKVDLKVEARPLGKFFFLEYDSDRMW